MKFVPLAMLAAALLATSAPAGTLTFESTATQAMLLELFTSEGCSSCPAADDWVSRLKTSPILWKRVVPVLFHVDYWNGLGWPDRFATAAHTARQRGYAAAWRGNSVYTPCFVLNGREWRGWFSRQPLPEPSSDNVGKLTVTLRNGSQADVQFAPVGAAPRTLQVELALLGGNLESDVKRGENSGRKLRHDFTVLHHSSTPLRAEGGRFVATVPLPAKTTDSPVSIAAWITSGDAQPAIQATGGWLEKRQPE